MRISSGGASSLQRRYRRRYRDPELQVRGDEARKILEYLRLHAATAQQIEQQFAAAGGFGGEQHARRDSRQCVPRVRPTGCSARGSMRIVAGAGLEKFCTGPAVSGGHSKERSCTCCHAANSRRNSAGGQVQLRRIENRAVAIVAQLFVPLDDALPQALHRRRWPRSCRPGRCAAAGTRIDATCDRRTAAGRTRYPPGAMPGADVAVDRLLGQITGESAAGSGGEIRAPRPG